MNKNVRINRFKLLIPLFLAMTVIVAGCATTRYTVTPVKAEHSRTLFQDGRENLLSEKVNVVAIAPANALIKSKSQESFVVVIQNRTNSDIVFSTDNISATHYSDQQRNSFALKVYSYNELVAEERKRQAWAAVAAGLQTIGDSMSAANAGYSSSYGSVSGTTYSPYGTAYTSGTYSSTTYDFGAAQAAQRAADARSDTNFARLATEGRANLERLASTILKKQTVFPGQWYGGIVKVDMPAFTESGQIDFSVDVSEEVHILQFTVEKQKKD